MLHSIRQKWLSSTACFRRDEDGIAAIEFAIIAPIMIMMYFGLAEMATAISMDRRISHGTNVAGDLATQSPSLATVDLEEILSASLRVMSVQDASKVYVDMEGFIRDSSGDAVSTGRVQLNNSQANLPSYLPEADALDNSILSETSGIVVTRVVYLYSPLKLRYFNSDIELKETFLLKPRRSDAVQIATDAGGDLNCSATSAADISCGGAVASP